MELRDIDYLATIARRGSLSRAADALNLTPAALSKSLRRLEEVAGTRLLERSSKGMRLTPAGRILVERSERVRQVIGDVRREIADLAAGRGGQVRLGTTPVDSAHLTRVCVALFERAPNIEFEIVEAADNRLLVPRLLAGELDLVVSLTSRRHDGVTHEPLCEDVFAVAAAPTHELADRTHLSPEDLVEHRWALDVPGQRPRQMLEQAFIDRGLPPPRVAVESASLDVRLAAIANSDCLGYHSRRYLAQSQHAPVRAIALHVPALEWRVSLDLMHRKNGWLSPAAQRVLAALRADSSWGA